MTSPAVRAAPGAQQVVAARRYLMCTPTYFDVEYQINPWMRPDRRVSRRRAVRQWRRLRDRLVGLGHSVDVMPAQDGLPDLVFTANGAIVIGDRALVARFRHAEREPESEHFAAALRALGVREVRSSQHLNEGEGDFLLTRHGMLGGIGPRSEPAAVDEVAEYFGVGVVPLRLVDARFYHVDTALARLDDDTIAYFPGAFDAPSRRALRELYPDAIVASEAEAATLGLNMVSDGHTVIMSPECRELGARIADRGFAVSYVSTSELRKAGGGAKCCVLEWHAAAARG